MFKYTEHNHRDLGHYNGNPNTELPAGYIAATGTYYDIPNHIDNLVAEIGKVPIGSLVYIVWENNYREQNQQVWDFYITNVVPHNFRPLWLDQTHQRVEFDQINFNVAREYHNNEIDFVHLPEHVGSTAMNRIVAALRARQLRIYGGEIEEVLELNSHMPKSARNC